jgi:hypothetical protein
LDSYFYFQKADKQLNRQRWRKGITLSKGNPIHSNNVHEKTTETLLPKYTSHTLATPTTKVLSPGESHPENIKTVKQEQVFTYEQCDIAEKEIVTMSEQSIEDWVVNSPHPSACTDVLREESFARIQNLDPRKEENDSIFDYDTASEDSAFVGSEGQYLRSSTSRTFAFNDRILQHGYYTSLRKPSPPPEPLPDYSVCGTVRIADEVEQVLNDFEGKLNEYCTISSVPVHQGFVDRRSEIYI